MLRQDLSTQVMSEASCCHLPVWYREVEVNLSIIFIRYSFSDEFHSYLLVKLHAVSSGTPLVKGNEPFYDQEFVL